MATHYTADEFKERILHDVARLLRDLQSTIDDDYRVEFQEDSTPTMQVTIACSDTLDRWAYRTGDTSFFGACYHYPHWGVGYLTKDADVMSLAESMIDDMLEQSEL